MVNKSPPLTESDLEAACASASNPAIRSSFHLAPVCEEEVLEALKLGKSKGAGLDGLSVPMLRAALPDLLPPLTSLVNNSLISALFPDEWKKALIVPLSKNKSPASESDTRPIALLPELSKMVERIVQQRLLGYLEAHQLLDPRQAGFRPGHSTQTALLGVLDDVRWAIDKRKITILVLLDFSKAFDTISHARLLMKLRNFNVANATLRWFFSYLADRLQAVVDEGGNISAWLRASSGVPQGSVLGPLLFAVYINDLPSVLRFARHMLFADDTQLYVHVPPEELLRGIEEISNDTQAIANWSRENGLKLNLDKSKVMILGSRQYTSGIDLLTIPRVYVDGIPLPYVTEAKNLGVWLTQNLDWQLHAKHVSRRVYAALSSLRFHKRALSLPLRKKLVQSLVLPIFDYASPVYADLDATRTMKLQRAQNACVRFTIGNIPRRAHVTPHRLALGWLSAKRRREYLLAVQAYSALAKKSPAYLLSRFSVLTSDSEIRRSARNPPQHLLYPAPRTEAWKQSFCIQASSLLNATEITEFSERSIPAFKRTLHRMLLAKDRADWESRVDHEGIEI